MDIAALLAVFQHVPSVVRRRAKELLDDIREAATVDVEVTVVEAPASASVAPDVTLVDDTPSLSAVDDKTVEDTTLWPTGE